MIQLESAHLMKPKADNVNNLLPLKIEPVTVQAQAVRALREAILSGMFQPGERLVETELSQRMGISRPSVREALRRLEAERLITIVPNRGPSVAEIGWEEAENIYQVRSLLEGEAAALFAARATEIERQRLSEAFHAFEEAVKKNDPLGRIEATNQYYDIILRGCGNPIIVEIIEGLVARINFLRAKTMASLGRTGKSVQEMRRLLRAIEAGDSTAARAAAVQHVRAASRAARKVYKEGEQMPEAIG